MSFLTKRPPNAIVRVLQAGTEIEKFLKRYKLNSVESYAFNRCRSTR
jgi:hypothetical protein